MIFKIFLTNLELYVHCTMYNRQDWYWQKAKHGVLIALPGIKVKCSNSAFFNFMQNLCIYSSTVLVPDTFYIKHCSVTENLPQFCNKFLKRAKKIYFRFKALKTGFWSRQFLYLAPDSMAPRLLAPKAQNIWSIMKSVISLFTSILLFVCTLFSTNMVINK